MDWSRILSTFGFVLLAELGDKTQLAVITQTCKYRTPWPVLVGGSLALSVVTALGALGGGFLAGVLSPHLIRVAAAMAFSIMGLLTLREAAKAPDQGEAGDVDACDSDEVGADTEPGVDGAASSSGWSWRAFASTFALLFVAELGDKTQLAVLGLASSGRAFWEVFLGGAAALASVTAMAVIGGLWLVSRVPQRTLLSISGGLFLIFGGLMITGTL